jgi:hypothetical protein
MHHASIAILSDDGEDFLSSLSPHKTLSLSLSLSLSQLIIRSYNMYKWEKYYG